MLLNVLQCALKASFGQFLYKLLWGWCDRWRLLVRRGRKSREWRGVSSALVYLNNWVSTTFLKVNNTSNSFWTLVYFCICSTTRPHLYFKIKGKRGFTSIMAIKRLTYVTLIGKSQEPTARRRQSMLCYPGRRHQRSTTEVLVPPPNPKCPPNSLHVCNWCRTILEYHWFVCWSKIDLITVTSKVLINYKQKINWRC